MITNTGISKSALGPAIENLAYTKEETNELLDAKANVSALSDGSVTKVGTINVGSDTKPIKLVGGVPTAVTNDLVSTTGNQSISGVKTVATETTGTYSSQIANSQKVKNELDAYSPMVRTTGNQTIAGTKTFASVIVGSARGRHLGVCGPTQAASGQFYKLGEIDNLPNNDGVVFTIFAGLNGSVYTRATYRIYRAGGVLYVQCLDRCYTTIYQKPKLYAIISGSGVIIYADTLSWCRPRLYLDYWETQGEIYASMSQHTLTLSNDWSIITPPPGIVTEIKLTSD